VVAAKGTDIRIDVLLQVVTAAGVPLNVTVLVLCVEPKFVPVIVTGEFSPPEVVDRLPIVGGIVYFAVATAELVSPLCSAIAFMVSDVETEMAAVYLLELLVGVVPLIV
jgi:hypothetical protein